MRDISELKKFQLPSSFSKQVDAGSYAAFLTEVAEKGDSTFAAFHFSFEQHDLLDEFKLFYSKDRFNWYWEKSGSSFAMAACGAVQEISASGSNRFAKINTLLNELSSQTSEFNSERAAATGIHYLGGFSFFDQSTGSDWKAFGSSSFILPKFLLRRNGNETFLTVTIPLPAKRSAESIHQQLTRALQRWETIRNESGQDIQQEFTADKSLTFINNHRKEWTRSVLDATETIAANGLEKVVMARQLHLKKHKNQSAAEIIGRLRKQYPECSTFLYQKPGAPAFIGSSPETLLSFQGDAIQTEALAGSIARGSSDEEDARLAEALSKSFKNNEEHRYVIRSLKQDLSPYVEQMNHPEKPAIKKLANVQHLYTPIQAKKNKDINPLSLLGSLHPTPAVGGYPRQKATQYIAEHESFSRGWFASPVGWLNSKGDGEFTVAIRSGLIDETEAILFAGCGIVADSDPDKEWQETNLKFMPMLSALNYD